DVAFFIQTSTVCAQMRRSRSRRLKTKKPDHRNCRLLRPRRGRPSHRATEQGDELAPPHRDDPKPKDAGTIAGQCRASQQKRPLIVRYELLSTFSAEATRQIHVRYCSNSDNSGRERLNGPAAFLPRCQTAWIFLELLMSAVGSLSSTTRSA